MGSGSSKANSFEYQPSPRYHAQSPVQPYYPPQTPTHFPPQSEPEAVPLGYPPPASPPQKLKPPGRKFSRRYSHIADKYTSIEQVQDELRRAGLESSNLIVGFDFTKSNEWTGKRTFGGKSLHAIGDQPNPYEQAISILGRTLATFDEDNLIPCFGFGDASTHDKYVFSFFPDHRPCRGFEEALARYFSLVPHVRLAGPTSFAPIIEAAMRIVEESGGQYHVLVIIADGQVTRSVDTEPGFLSPQEKSTIDAIVAASQYALSIVLVGVGDGPWDMMQEFDDNIPARSFDNFQFVNFSEIMKRNLGLHQKEAMFALSALMEVPSQYRATVELGMLGRRIGSAPSTLPLPPPDAASRLASSAPEAAHTAAQLMAKIAAIELPQGQWPELINLLLANMALESAELKKATLEALGYVCEEVSAEVLAQEQVNAMLTAVVQGMNSSETNSEVRLSATRALCNALDFAQTNFDNEVERSYIMRVVCEATLSPDMRVRQSAFECLVAIASTYYDKLQPYMQEIFNITSKAVKQDEEPAALQAIEFWSAICDEEIELQESVDLGYPTSYGFIRKALSYLVPLLLEAMTKQEEDQELEDDVWNLSMAAGTCLGLVARTVEDDIVPLVMPFIQENIVLPDWRRREAATYAFGSILEGPSLEKLTPLVNSALPFMLHAMTRDENRYVKDTTAWTLGRIFEFLHGPRVKVPVITPDNLPHILSTLLESLKDASNVAERTCGALYYLAQGFEDARPPSPLSPFFQNIVEALLITAGREDAAESRLRSAAYETLNEVIRNSTEDTSQVTVELVPVIIGKLNNTLYMTVLSSDDKEKQGDLQALLCGVLQVIIQKLSVSDSGRAAVVQFADQMMGLFLKVFACRSATVHEEAMLAIGALAYACGVSFGKYMQEFYPYLEMGLQNFEEYQVCAITVGVVGDICRALDEKVLPFCDGIMTHLLKDLSSSQLHRSVKPPIFSCFGDIALAIEGQFDKYLPYALPMLQGAAEITAQQANADEEVIEHNNQLRTGILEAYSGILQGFKSAKRSEVMLPHAGHVLQFIESIYRDKDDRDEAVTKAAVGVLGDLADSLGPASADLFRQATFYKDFIDEVQAFEDVHLRNTAQWALVTISKLVS